MKKKAIIGSVSFVVLIILLIVVGYFIAKYENREKTYSTDDFTFVSRENFKKKKLENYDYYFENESSNVVVLGIKEEKEELSKLEGYESLSLSDYAKVIYDGEENTTSELKYNEKENYYYFNYNYKGVDGDIFYIAAMYETSDAFYIINFASELNKQKDYENSFIEWANSFEFKKK